MKKNNLLNLKYFKQNRGFTVLETIVAILILSMAVSGVFAAVQQGLSQGANAKDEVAAYYLAQEAIEIIKNNRSSNQLAIFRDGSGHWLTGISRIAGDPCFSQTCKADAYHYDPLNNYVLIPCGGSDFESCPVLQQDIAPSSPSYIFSYDAAWPNAKFKRSIQVENISDHEISVTVRISWSKGLVNREFKIKTLLFNWM